MLCLSLPLSSLDQIGRQLLKAYPHVYDSFIPATMQKNPLLANIIRVAARETTQSELAPFYNVENLKTLGGSEFVAFHKSTYFYDDLYAQLVAKQLKSSLFTETWSNGVGTQPSNCTTQYPVHNIDIIRFNSYNTQFTVNSDHSKWGLNVPTDITQGKYICIGDINRQISQYKRGGGTVCFKNNAAVGRSLDNTTDKYVPPKNDIKPYIKNFTNQSSKIFYKNIPENMGSKVDLKNMTYDGIVVKFEINFFLK